VLAKCRVAGIVSTFVSPDGLLSKIRLDPQCLVEGVSQEEWLLWPNWVRCEAQIS